MKKQAIQDALFRTVGITTGGATSKIVAAKVPVKNMHLKRGGLVLTGTVLAALVDRSSQGKAFVQDLGIGMAGTQLASWVYDAFEEKLEEGSLVKTALGNPVGSYNNPVQYRMGYANMFPKTETIDTEHVDVTFEL